MIRAHSRLGPESGLSIKPFFQDLDQMDESGFRLAPE